MATTRYRCYFLQGYHVKDVNLVEADDDAEALLNAVQLRAPSKFQSLEVWKQERLVVKLPAQQAQ